MHRDSDKRVFISYVVEDQEAVNKLCKALKAASIPYWLDRNDLEPGDNWRAKIRSAIQKDALVFLACFSENYRTRETSYMNEELTLAIDEFRKRPPSSTWLIPVRLDEGPLPGWELGAGQTLDALNYVDLFGEDYTPNIARLITVLHRQLGDNSPSPAMVRAAIDQASAEDRVRVLKQLTKEALPSPSRQIELADAISQEVRRVLATLTADEHTASLEGTDEQQLIKVVKRAQDYWQLVAPFCSSLQVASRWATPEQITPWSSGIYEFVTTAVSRGSGNSALLSLRHLPGMVSIMTAALAVGSNGKFENLKALVCDATVKTRSHARPVSLLEATYPYAPFSDQNDLTINVLARAAKAKETPEEAFKALTGKRKRKYHTPAAEWMHSILRPIFEDQWHDDSIYSNQFDRAEIMLGVLAQDFVRARLAANSGGRGLGRSLWFGRSTYRVHYHGSPVADLLHELNSHGSQWGPLTAGLFARDVERATAAIQQYQEIFTRISQSRW